MGFRMELNGQEKQIDTKHVDRLGKFIPFRGELVRRPLAGPAQIGAALALP